MSGFSRIADRFCALKHRPGLLRRAVRAVLIVLLVLLILIPTVYVCALPRTSWAAAPEKYALAGIDALQSLEVDETTGRVLVTAADGRVWSSNPEIEKIEADELAKGVSKMTMYSQLVIRYCDADNRQYTATSYANALDAGERAPEIVREEDKIQVTYRFLTGKEADNLYISLTVEYRLEAGALWVSVPLDRIQENDRYRLVDVAVLPYFGAGSPEEEGYLLLPDGNGAVVDFNTVNTGAVEYSRYIYGRDPAISLYYKDDETQPVCLPVFGVRHEGAGGFLAVIDEGDALASVTASSGGISTQWNNAYFTFRYREYTTISLNEMTWNERNLPYLGEVNNDVEAFTIAYFFLPEDRAEVADMAAVNRDYLMQRYGMTPVEAGGSRWYVDLPISVQTTQAVLGLPMETVRPLTTFPKAGEILDSLQSLGMDALWVKLSSWKHSQVSGTLSSTIDAESAAGGKSGWRELMRKAESAENILLFPSADFTSAQGTGGGFIPFLQGGRGISGSLASQPHFLPSTQLDDPTADSEYLVNPAFANGLLQRFAENLRKEGGRAIAVDGYASAVYSDTYHSVFDFIAARQPVDRAGAAGAFQSGLRALRQDFDAVMVDGANMYALPYATDVLGIPLTSSRYTLFTEEVPYLQMVLSGLVYAAGTPVNFEEDPESVLLQCLQYGTYPQFCFTAGDSTLVKDTELNAIYNAEYRLWTDKLEEWAEQYGPLYARVGGHTVISMQREGNVVSTTFESGDVLVIDYAAKTAQLQ